MPPAEVLRAKTTLGEVAIHVTGSGPAVVLLHANPGSSGDYDVVVAHLAEEHQVLAVDWPGYGLSPAPTTWDFKGAMSFRDCLIELLEGLAGAHGFGPFVLIGSSVGGFAALGAVAARPDLVAGLVLVAPGGFTSQNLLTRWVCRSLGRPAVARRMAKPLARCYLRRRNDTTRRGLATAGTIATDSARRDVFAAVWRSFAEPEHDLRRLTSPAVPILLTWGRFDPVLPVRSDGRSAARSLGVELHRYPTGHEPYAELPEAWLADVRPFLASIPKRQGRWLGATAGEGSR